MSQEQQRRDLVISFNSISRTPVRPTMVERTTPRFISFLSVVLLSMGASAQQYSISDGTITACTGVMHDSGGPSGSYGDNENYTVVICPDQPGDGIFLTWSVWNLNSSGPNNNLDRIRIWDGNSTAGTYLGEYNAPPQGGVAAATTFNPSGCLTVQFISNGAGTGDFAASITCFTPCDRPLAAASMSEPGPALVCVGEVVDFDGTASTAAPTFNITNYEWVFDDGTTATGSTASHSFAEPGEYIVQLNLLDDNDCVNANVVDLQVLVSTTPSFLGTVESIESCLGATVNLDAVVSPVTWTGIPEATFGDGVYLPDSLGVPYNSSLVFTQFDPGQTVTNLSDIIEICVNMEHSFMGDLVLSLACPNGNTIVFHQQGGGGTFLGDANDTDGNANPVPGVCWNYCWSPTATQGTWVDNSQFGATPNTMPSSQGNALIPGTYNSIQPFSNLLGCPLNGTWTYTSLDLWGADNGFLCGWNIEFNPAIIPDVTQFTPVLDTTDPDSAFWTGPFLVTDPTNPLSGTATPTGPGDYDYVFSVTDNFGCTYDTTITVTVPLQVELDAGPAITLCSDPLPMAGEITANGPPTNCVWDLVLYDTAFDGWNGNASLSVNIDGVISSYTLATGSIQTIPLSVSTGAMITLTFTAGTIWNNENSFDLINDAGTAVFESPNGPSSGVSYTGVVVCGGGTTPFTFEWTPTTGLTTPNSATSLVYVTEPTWYYLSAYPNGHPECAVMDSVLVSPDPSIDAGISDVLIMCASDPNFMLTDSLGGTPDAGGIWTLTDGTIVPNAFEPINGVTDIYTYTIISAAGCVASSQLDITMIPATDPTCCGIPDAGLPLTSCDLTNPLSATPGNTGVGQWDGPTGAVFGDLMSAQTTVTMPIGGGGTHMFYWRENDGAFCNTVDSVEMTFTDPYVFTPTLTNALCYGYCDGAVHMAVTGGNAIADLNYFWSTGVSGIALDSIVDLCAGEYALVVSDDNDCRDTTTITITEPVLLRIDSLAYQPVTCSGDCDGQVEIYDVEAVDYSFDDGATWSTGSTMPDACEGIHLVRIKNAIGCIGSGFIEVMGPPPVIAEFGWGPNPATINAPTITFVNQSANADRYAWNVADQHSTTDVNTEWTFTNKFPGTYEVCLEAYNYNDCPDTICHNIVIDDVLVTYIPNSFTPDGDGKNDAWGMSMNIPTITEFEMLVFDRLGQVVYNTTDPYKPWLGSFENGGAVLKTDVYAYRILYTIQETQARKELVGHVTLIK